MLDYHRSLNGSVIGCEQFSCRGGAVGGWCGASSDARCPGSRSDNGGVDAGLSQVRIAHFV